MSFLPKNYQVPQLASASGQYTRFVPGDTRVRILAGFSNGAIMGFEYWSEENGKRTPVRVKAEAEIKPDEIAKDKEGKPGRVKHFWALPVYNYREARIQIMEITQAGIQTALTTYAQDEDWGDPTEYDVVIKRTGEDLNTTYEVIPKPRQELKPEIVKMWKEVSATLDLNELFAGGDPFNPGTAGTKKAAPAEEVDIDDIPWDGPVPEEEN